jgi:hypothetical protein
MAMTSIAHQTSRTNVPTPPQSDPTAQTLLDHYPAHHLHHWFSQGLWQVTRAKQWLDACQGPTADLEDMRLLYADALAVCAEILAAVSLPPHLAQRLFEEDQQLTNEILAQRTRKVGVRRRKRAPVPAAAD